MLQSFRWLRLFIEGRWRLPLKRGTSRCGSLIDTYWRRSKCKYALQTVQSILDIHYLSLKQVMVKIVLKRRAIFPAGNVVVVVVAAQIPDETSEDPIEANRCPLLLVLVDAAAVIAASCNTTRAKWHEGWGERSWLRQRWNWNNIKYQRNHIVTLSPPLFSLIVFVDFFWKKGCVADGWRRTDEYLARTILVLCYFFPFSSSLFHLSFPSFFPSRK